MSTTYDGDELWIEEMPQGCVIASKLSSQGHVVIASPKDALAVIDSLKKMMRIKFTDEYYEYVVKHS